MRTKMSKEEREGLNALAAEYIGWKKRGRVWETVSGDFHEYPPDLVRYPLYMSLTLGKMRDAGFYLLSEGPGVRGFKIRNGESSHLCTVAGGGPGSKLRAIGILIRYLKIGGVS